MLVLPMLPILIPLTTAIVCLFVRNSIPAMRAVSVTGAVALVVAAAAVALRVHADGAPIASQAAGWFAPYGITIVADELSVILVVMTAIVQLGVLIYALGALDARREKAFFHPLYHTLITAVCGAFLTGDIFNMYVWFEVMLLSSFVLITLGGERAQLEGGIKYVTLNLVSSALFLTAIGLLYGLAGTLNFADLHVALQAVDFSDPANSDSKEMLTLIAMLFLAAFGIKAALWPFFFWLPASYHTPPPVIAAIFAGLLTKVGVYSVVRVFTLVFGHDPGFVYTVLLVLATISMLSGVLGAAVQYEVRRILAFHSVSQVGYMLMGFAIASLAWHGAGEAQLAGDATSAASLRTAATLALAGSIYFIFHHGIVKMNLFLIAGLIEKRKGSAQLKRIGGLFSDDWPLAAVFFVTSMALAGIPILSGFWAKLALVRAGLMSGQYLVIGVSLFVSILTLFSMTKIWAEAFWKPQPDDGDDVPIEFRPTAGRMALMFAPTASFAAIALFIGVGVGPLFDLCMSAARGVLEPMVYVEAVNPARLEAMQAQGQLVEAADDVIGGLTP
ncbi:MAG: proton-conducting transporter membrane subunit [Planctomycetota bacterium]